MGQTIEELANNITLYRESLARHGYDSEIGQVTVLLHTFIGIEVETARSQARQPFYNYLRSSVGLFKKLVSSQGLNIDLEKVSEEDFDLVFANAYERYVETSALIGTPESCQPIINKLSAIGVNEIACFIDFGIEEELVLNGLNHLHKLKQYYQ